MERSRPGRPRSRAAHAAILDAAIALVREVGYDAVAMDAIAARAGVGKATVYRRWKSKEALVCEALERIMRSIPPPDTGTTRGDLMALMREQQALYADPGTAGLLSGLVAAMNRSERLAEVIRGGFYATRKAPLLEVLRRGVRRGDLRKGLDTELALDLFNGPLFYRFLFTGVEIDDRLARGVVNAILSALAPRGDVTAPAVAHPRSHHGRRIEATDRSGPRGRHARGGHPRRKAAPRTRAR